MHFQPELERLTIPKDQIALILDSPQWANDFKWQQILQLAAYFEAYRCKRGVVLLEQGEADRRMMVIVSGIVDIVKRRGSQEPQQLAKLRAGHTLGEMSMIDDEPRSASAVTASGVKLLLITKESVDRLAVENPSLGYEFVLKISRMLSQRLRLTTGMLIELNNPTPN